MTAVLSYGEREGGDFLPVPVNLFEFKGDRVRGWGYFCVAAIAGVMASRSTVVAVFAFSRNNCRTRCQRASRTPVAGFLLKSSGGRSDKGVVGRNCSGGGSDALC